MLTKLTTLALHATPDIWCQDFGNEMTRLTSLTSLTFRTAFVAAYHFRYHALHLFAPSNFAKQLRKLKLIGLTNLFNLASLIWLENLEKLTLKRCKIESLFGISTLHKLKKLKIIVKTIMYKEIIYI